MCNDYRLEVDIASIAEDFDDLKIKIKMPEGTPNVAAREDINITDIAPIVRSVEGERGSGELVNRRWSWPGPGGKPVYNYRSDGRDFPRGRCIILADGFYEFTAHSDPKSKRKHKWLFTLKDHGWFGIAGLWRHDAGIGEEAFTMLTIEPHADVAPYHSRGVPILGRDDMARWLDPAVPSREILRPLPAGSLTVEQIA